MMYILEYNEKGMLCMLGYFKQASKKKQAGY